jgi:hypothetical protein
MQTMAWTRGDAEIPRRIDREGLDAKWRRVLLLGG